MRDAVTCVGYLMSGFEERTKYTENSFMCDRAHTHTIRIGKTKME